MKQIFKKSFGIIALLSTITVSTITAKFIGTSEPISEAIKERIVGKSWKPECPIPLEDLRYLRITYLGYDNQEHLGEMIVHKDVADDIIAIFQELFEHKFPIERMQLIEAYFEEGRDDRAIDNAAVADNNTSAFFFRYIGGTTIVSEHGLGTALDINSAVNPFYDPQDGHICPPNAHKFLDRQRDDVKGLIKKGSVCEQAFKKRGWKWGGDWKNVKDYQHFCLKEIIPASFNS